MTNTIEMLHEMDDMACLALLGCPQTPGLQNQKNFPLKIFKKIQLKLSHTTVLFTRNSVCMRKIPKFARK